MSDFKIFKFQPKIFGEYVVLDVDYHRNGISGEGFMTGIFKCNSKEPSESGTFIFTLFESWSGEGKEYSFDKASGDYKCAILRLEDLNSGTAENAWRGDYFYGKIVQKAVVEYNKQEDKFFETFMKKNN